MATIFKPAPPKRPSSPTSAKMTQTPCSQTFTDTQGRTVVYSGLLDTDGKCVFYNRRIVASSFDGERSIWTDLTGKEDAFTNVDGDSCAFKNPDGTFTTGVIKNGVCTLPASKFDTAASVLNKAFDLGTKIVDLRGGKAQDTVVVQPTPTSKGVSTGAVLMIVAGVAVVATVGYFALRKK